MLYGEAPAGVRIGEPRNLPVMILAASLGLLVVLGVALPRPISTLIDRSVQSIQSAGRLNP
jgi:hypothetical protein